MSFTSTIAGASDAERTFRKPGRPATLTMLAAICFALGACGSGGPSSSDSLETAAAGESGATGLLANDAAGGPGANPKASSPYAPASPTVSDVTNGGAAADAVTSPAAPAAPPLDTAAPPKPSAPDTPSTPPTSPTPAEPPVSTAPIRFSGLRILPLGDSMTGGDESAAGSYRSYRGALQQLLAAAGHDTDFVGTISLKPAVGGDPDHNGHGGAQIGPGGGSNNIHDRLDGILGSVGDVDAIILAMGWNSVYQEPLYAAAKYEALVRRIAALRPKATIVLGTLSPQRTQTEQKTNAELSGYRELNARARQLANASSSDKLVLADLASATYSSDDYWDVIHWRQSGANKAAQVIFDALVANAAIVNNR